MVSTLKKELIECCRGTSLGFTEGVLRACRVLFEDEQNQKIPVDTQNVVNSDVADTIPAQLKTAQTTAKQVETEQQKLDALKKTADEQVNNLRDTLAVASSENQSNQNQNGTGTTNATT